MFDTILVPLDGSASAEAALAVAAQLPSRKLRLLTVRSDLTRLEDVCESAETGEAYLEHVAEPLREQGRQVETTVIFGDARRQIVAFAAMADLVVMGSRGCGATSAFLLGSVADWVVRHAATPTMIVRVGSSPAVTMPLTRVVVALDGSPLAEEALPLAGEVAALLGLPIHLVRVLDFDIVRASVQAGIEAALDSAERERDQVAEAQAYLDARALQLQNRNLLVTSDVRSGAPTAELEAALRPGDLLVLATRDRGGLERWLLGSVADHLVRHAPGPVLLVRAGTQQRLRGGAHHSAQAS
jgi:nucleotide-binding universal stress UspA family protein